MNIEARLNASEDYIAGADQRVQGCATSHGGMTQDASLTTQAMRQEPHSEVHAVKHGDACLFSWLHAAMRT